MATPRVWPRATPRAPRHSAALAWTMNALRSRSLRAARQKRRCSLGQRMPAQARPNVRTRFDATMSCVGAAGSERCRIRVTEGRSCTRSYNSLPSSHSSCASSTSCYRAALNSGVPSRIRARPLKKPFSDGTVAVDLDPLSLLCRLVALVPAPRFHTMRYFSVLAAAAQWRPLVVPKPEPSQATENGTAPDAASPCSAAPSSASGSHYRPWAKLLRRTFAVDVETCPRCGGRMRLLAVLTDLTQVARFLHHRGEPTEPPARAPPRDPPYFQDLRRSTATTERALHSGRAVRGALNPEASAPAPAMRRRGASRGDGLAARGLRSGRLCGEVTTPFRGPTGSLRGSSGDRHLGPPPLKLPTRHARSSVERQRAADARETAGETLGARRTRSPSADYLAQR
jgi:hypothetical protein